MYQKTGFILIWTYTVQYLTDRNAIMSFVDNNSKDVPIPMDTGIATFMKNVFSDYEKIRGKL